MIREVTGEDDYLICSEYEKRADQLSGKHPDFICFYHEMTGEVLFCMDGFLLECLIAE